MLQGQVDFGHIVVRGAQIVQRVGHLSEVCGGQEHAEVEKLHAVIWDKCLSVA